MLFLLSVIFAILPVGSLLLSRVLETSRHLLSFSLSFLERIKLLLDSRIFFSPSFSFLHSCFYFPYTPSHLSRPLSRGAPTGHSDIKCGKHRLSLLIGADAKLNGVQVHRAVRPIGHVPRARRRACLCVRCGKCGVSGVESVERQVKRGAAERCVKR